MRIENLANGDVHISKFDKSGRVLIISPTEHNETVVMYDSDKDYQLGLLPISLTTVVAQLEEIECTDKQLMITFECDDTFVSWRLENEN